MAKRRVKAEDLRRFKFVSDPQISPDGGHVAFVHTRVDYEGNRYLSNIWIWDVEGGRARPFTSGPGRDTNPRWSPKGDRLLFLGSGRQPDAKTQLYVISASGGEARLVADLEHGVSNPRWSPDGRRILFTSRVWTEEKPKSDVKRITRLRYRFNNVGYFHRRRTHLFTVGAGGGRPRQLTQGEFDVADPRWSSDGKSITFIANMEPDQDTSRVADIYRVPRGGGEPVKLTDSTYNIQCHSHQPGGDQVAFIGHHRPQELAVDYELYLLAPEGGEAQLLTGGFNRSLLMGVGSDMRVSASVEQPVWSSCGRYLYFNTADTPYCNLYRLEVESRRVEVLVSGKTVDGFSVSEGGVVAFNAMTSLEPCELYLLREGVEEKLTGFNKRLLEGLQLSEPEHFTFTNRLGRVVDGWVMKPVGFREGGKYPCILEMHGGPRGVYGEGFYLEFHLLCSQGYAVIYTNPRGSAGYEEEYAQAVMGHYGEVDYEDFMDFVDEALARYPWLDEHRLGLTGGSYGGYTTNWIIGHTDRFKAAVTCRSISNWVSKMGVSDIGFMQPESVSGVKTLWGDDLFEHIRRSPLYYAGNVKTPCLVIHSEEDYRCPMDQAEQWFTALKLNNVPTELIRFPGENHELSRSGKPKHRVERLQHILRWFKAYLGDAQRI